MKKQNLIFILSVLGIIFLLQKNGYSQNNNALNKISADKDSVSATNITDPNDKPSAMILSADKEGTINTNQNNNDNAPVDSVNVISDFIISSDKDPQNN